MIVQQSVYLMQLLTHQMTQIDYAQELVDKVQQKYVL